MIMADFLKKIIGSILDISIWTNKTKLTLSFHENMLLVNSAEHVNQPGRFDILHIKAYLNIAKFKTKACFNLIKTPGNTRKSGRD